MNKSILVAALAAAVGLSPMVADAATHKTKQHKSHAMSKGSNGEQSGTTGMGTGGASGSKSTSGATGGASSGSDSMK